MNLKVSPKLSSFVFLTLLRKIEGKRIRRQRMRWLDGIANSMDVRLYKLRRRQWQPTPVLLPGEFHGWRSLVGYSAWSREELGTTDRLHFHFSLSCIGEGNGNPLQCSCLENPRDRGAWWAAVCGVTQSRTPLMRLSSSSSMTMRQPCQLQIGTCQDHLP